MMLDFMRLFAALSLLAIVKASPSSYPNLQDRDVITSLTPAQINAFTPTSWFASAAYCDPSLISSWTCGQKCDANPNFQPVASGGDGGVTQYWFVGYDPDLQTIVVAHQGTNASEIVPIATDIDFILRSLNSTLFPGIDPSVEVHSGFATEQEITATTILSHIQSALSTFNTNSVTLTGHSLGAAIALLDAVYLPLHLPPSTNFRTVLYGQPRVGNEAFADYVDAHVQELTRINNKKDLVPTVPMRFLGYVHASGEVHIRENGEWVSCPGHDNPSTQCIVGDVPIILAGNPLDHPGPYNGAFMGLNC